MTTKFFDLGECQISRDLAPCRTSIRFVCFLCRRLSRPWDNLRWWPTSPGTSLSCRGSTWSSSSGKDARKWIEKKSRRCLRPIARSAPCCCTPGDGGRECRGGGGECRGGGGKCRGGGGECRGLREILHIAKFWSLVPIQSSVANTVKSRSNGFQGTSKSYLL